MPIGNTYSDFNVTYLQPFYTLSRYSEDGDDEDDADEDDELEEVSSIERVLGLVVFKSNNNNLPRA